MSKVLEKITADNTDYRLLVGATESTHGKCPNPKCGTCFDNGDIPKEHHHCYSAPYKWSKLIGVEISERYDGVLIWRCPDCGFMWHRFTGRKVTEENWQSQVWSRW